MEPCNRNHIRIAQLSARIILEEGVNDYAIAKRKAAQRLRLDWEKMPDDQIIEAALHEYHRIFRFQHQPAFIRGLREIALEAMEFLAEFSPRLVGAVLEGTAGEYSPITLHLFPETPEAVIWKLVEANIRYKEEPLITAELGNHEAKIPVLSFHFKEHPTETFLYPPKALRAAPKNGTCRASIKALRCLIRKGAQS
ncbi:MAG: hypothetical protein ACK4JF_06785 [Methylohalobius sp.]